jgi:hypothetical protein
MNDGAGQPEGCALFMDDLGGSNFAQNDQLSALAALFGGDKHDNEQDNQRAQEAPTAGPVRRRRTRNKHTEHPYSLSTRTSLRPPPGCIQWTSRSSLLRRPVTRSRTRKLAATAEEVQHCSRGRRHSKPEHTRSASAEPNLCRESPRNSPTEGSGGVNETAFYLNLWSLK